MRKLDARYGAMTLDGVSHERESAELAGCGKREMQHLRTVGFRVNDQLAYRHNGRTPLCAQLIETLRARPRRSVRIDIGCTHRSRAHPIAQSHVSYVQRFAQVRIISLHGFPFSFSVWLPIIRCIQIILHQRLSSQLHDQEELRPKLAADLQASVKTAQSSAQDNERKRQFLRAILHHVNLLGG